MLQAVWEEHQQSSLMCIQYASDHNCTAGMGVDEISLGNTEVEACQHGSVGDLSDAGDPVAAVNLK